MATIKTYSFTSEELTEEVNKAKELFLQQMLKEKIITVEQEKELLRYSIIVHSKSVLGSFWDFIWTGDKLGWCFSIVKIISFDDNPDKK